MKKVPIAAPKATKKEWLGLAVLALPCILYAMDFTVLQLAVPHLIRDLQPSQSELLWIMDIYGFVLAGALIVMGILGDKIGRRKLLLIGAFLFGVASLLAAFSQTATQLIISRAVLGLAAATLAPSTLSLLSNMFQDAKERTIAISVWMTSFSVGSAIGPLVGGALLMHYWWGSVFLIAIPVMLFLLLIGPKLLPEYKNESAGRLDVGSAALTLLTILPIIYGIKHTASHGFDVVSAAMIAAGLAFGYWFVRRQKMLAQPFVDLQLFRSRTFSSLLLVYLSVFFVMFAVFYFISQYLQLVRGMSSLEAGLWTLPWAVAFIVSSMATSRMVQKLGLKRLLLGGLLLAGVGLGILALLQADTPLPLYAMSLSMVAIGFAPVMGLITDSIIDSVPPHRAGMASGVSETAAELGGALGIAVFGSLAAFIYTSYLQGAHLPQGIGDSLGAALQAAQNFAPGVGHIIVTTTQTAYMHSLQWVFGLSAVLIVAAAGMLRWAYRRKPE
ncbi:MAG TPA: MFS transporter [Verrucomicrobiae bacterium]|nr:MFS transporter [Verrucomicrobiae bacterium]